LPYSHPPPEGTRCHQEPVLRWNRQGWVVTTCPARSHKYWGKRKVKPQADGIEIYGRCGDVFPELQENVVATEK